MREGYSIFHIGNGDSFTSFHITKSFLKPYLSCNVCCIGLQLWTAHSKVMYLNYIRSWVQSSLEISKCILQLNTLSRAKPISNNYQVRCEVTDDHGNVLDLSPLVRGSGYHLALNTAQGTETGASFYINVCRPLNPILGTLCPPQAAACKVTANKPEVSSLKVPASFSKGSLYSNFTDCLSTIASGDFKYWCDKRLDEAKSVQSLCFTFFIVIHTGAFIRSLNCLCVFLVVWYCIFEIPALKSMCI